VTTHRLPVPWRAVPGNHDIGDNPWAGAPAGSAVDAARHQRWLDTVGADHWLDIVGADHWLATVGGWIVLAVNAQLLDSGLEAEAAQWAWLEERIGRHRGRQPIALITHKPVTATEAELAAAPPYRFWPPSARGWLARLPGGTPPAPSPRSAASSDHLQVNLTYQIVIVRQQVVKAAARRGPWVRCRLGEQALG